MSGIAPYDRVFHVQMWMMRILTARLKAGGLAVPPPILSRTYQVLSDGTAAAFQARKVSYIEFPFPLRQLLAVLLAVFCLLAPMAIAAFMDSVWLTGSISFFVVLGYVALNETARELEQPFGMGANNLHLNTFQKQFNSKLARLLDQKMAHLGYEPVKSTNASEQPPAPTNGNAVQQANSSVYELSAAQPIPPPPTCAPADRSHESFGV